MRMLVSVEFADAGTMTGKHSVLVVGGCSDTTAPGDIGISLEEAKTLLSALQCEYVAAQAAEITEAARECEACGARLQIKDWSRRSVQLIPYLVAYLCKLRDSLLVPVWESVPVPCRYPKRMAGAI